MSMAILQTNFPASWQQVTEQKICLGTGNWRLATTSDSIVPAECAVEYYKTMFSSDDEIHGIWNATLGTMTSISVGSGMLFVDTYEYVNGEEHDAKLMFSGNKLMSEVFDLSTDQPLDD